MAAKRDKFTTLENLFLKTPLYEEVSIEKRETIVKEILTYGGALDTYCPECKQSATFRGQITADTKRDVSVGRMPVAPAGHSGARYVSPWDKPDIAKSLVCTRKGHRIEYFFRCEDEFIVKVGQYPSIADIEIGDTEKYEAILGRERLKEFNRAIGLTAHGVGIGAHVYLRRIFEALVEEAHQATRDGTGWDENKYQQSRMIERIQLVSAHLPDFLVKNQRLYALLSKGLHELSEQECLGNFDALKLAIEVILDEKLKKREEQQKSELARKALAKIDALGKSSGN